MDGVADDWAFDVASALVEPTFEFSLLRKVALSGHVISLSEAHAPCAARGTIDAASCARHLGFREHKVSLDVDMSTTPLAQSEHAKGSVRS